jgi:leader peptidase (prepilin peptidase)/N-methyltransferase
VDGYLTIYHYLFIFVLGAIFGSFINVVIYRLPRNVSLVWPPSACPSCGERIKFYDNVPILSYMFLRGRCRRCSAGISARYPAVEAVSGLLLVWVVAIGGPPGLVASRAVLVLFLLAIALIDWEHMIIPDELSLGGCAVGFGLGFFNPEITVTDSLLGMFLGGGALLGIGYFYQRVRRVEGLGGGDVKLAAMVGAFLGWKGLVICILGGSFAGSVYGLALMASGKGAQTKVPFGTFLAAGAILAAFYAEPFLRWYAGLFRG